MKNNTIGLDIAKRVFQAHWVEESTGEICRKQLKRLKVLEFFSKQAKSVVVMEACVSAHYWAREISKFGHEVRLISPHFVRPYVKSNKTDASDAQAIWTAGQQPEMRFVAVKKEGQQAILALHRMRYQLVKFRTMQVNQIRGILYEFGVVLPQGRSKAMRELLLLFAQMETSLPGLVRGAIEEQVRRVKALDEEIKKIEILLAQYQREDLPTQQVAGIPGVGLLTATALTATLGNPSVFKSGREFAAFLGLVPRQSGTGGKVRLLGISKRGDGYLRSLLIHGARAVIHRSKESRPWLKGILARRHKNIVTVALANKMARIAWALLAHQRNFDSKYGAVASI